MPFARSFAAVALSALPLSRCLSIVVPGTVPDNASDVVDQAFVGFGIESTSFQLYALSGQTGSQTNQWTQNILSGFADRTGAPVNIRVGGTSLDNARFDATQEPAVRYENATAPHTLHSPITLGQRWLAGLRALADVTWVLQLPFARGNQTNAVEFANAGLASMTAGTLDALEIGNEPQWYHTAVYNDRNASWSPEAYLEEWDEWARAVLVGTGLHQVEGPHFHGLTLAGVVPPEWNSAKVLDSLDNSTVKAVSQHYYQSTNGGTLQDTLMNHTFTKTRMANYSQAIRTLQTNGNNIPIVFGEVGSALGDGGSADYALNSRLGAALWTVDWLLYAMTLGIRQVSMQLGIDYPFAGFQPATVNASSSPYASPTNNTDHPARVLGGFYGDVFVADFIGRDGELRVAELATANENITAYAGYSGDALRKIALVDLSLWNGTAAQGERPSQTVTLQGLGDATERVMVQRLTGPGGMALATEISWAGQQWLTEGNGRPSTTRNDTLTIDVGGGVVDVEIMASEALLVTLL
ncbi:uncharacterized protein J3D65DRAFT_618158 [Phyllosticta citribraziliensis]|uniref:Beta-glucuronidase C-terminal domain-containing protein n=1 Tax=Phyllosticta citribraziliensis TaxID=989973 RepID=A0ABR1LVU3_9PEZI